MNPPATLTLIFTRVCVGLLFSALIGLAAYRRRSLARSGVVGAILTGTLIFGFGGFSAGVLLIVFFLTSSALSHYKAARKQRVADQFDKGGQRDLGQALANGGGAALCGVGSGLAFLTAQPTATLTLCMAALMGALAAANADTWATELGVLSRSAPRLITHLAQRVEPGTSGGVTLVGTLAAVAGAVLIGLVNVLLYALLSPLVENSSAGWRLLYNWAIPTLGQMATLWGAALVGGVTGALADSVLGATVQAMYYSEQRRKPTEKQHERDGTPNRLLRGWPWLNNDGVNFIATFSGAIVSLLVYRLVGF
jgi:uncharacterized protein (TIGR00297 family)